MRGSSAQPEWLEPDQGAQVDTRTYIPGAGSMPVTLQVFNAAGVETAYSEKVQVDNDPVNVALSTPDHPNPSVSVNHAVTVDANATAGPSGVAGMNCSVDGSDPAAYPAGGVTVDGDGTHTVVCTAGNGAVDPQGQPNSGSSSETVKIDQAPPAVTFEPQNPGDPTELVVDTSDSESGVAGGIDRHGARGNQSLDGAADEL